MTGVQTCALPISTVEAAINGNTVDDATIAKAAAAATAAVTPNGDIHASAAYRKALTGTLVERALKAAAA